MSEGIDVKHATYAYGDSSKPGVLLGFPVRVVLPFGVGILVATVGLMVAWWPLVIAGPIGGFAVSFEAWRQSPLYESAVPGVRLLARRGRATWTPSSLLAAGPGFEQERPRELRGLEAIETTWPWTPGPVGVIRDRPFKTLSATISATADGFAMKSLHEQDVMLAAFGACASPLARPQSPAAKLTWQEHSYPRGVDAHRSRVGMALARRDEPHPDPGALADYDVLLTQQAPVTVAHEVTLTLTIDIRRVRRRRRLSQLDAAVLALGEEMELFVQRLRTADITTSAPLSAEELAVTNRRRSDPTRGRPRRLEAMRQSLATATGRAGIEWGPMAVEETWTSCKVDDSLHRTYRMASMPLLPVPANWMDSVLTDTATTRTVTVVFEPIPINKAAAAASREATTLEASSEEKTRRGFRVTARERRRLADVEAREAEMARGHPEFRHAGLITVTAPSPEALDDACAQMENAAGKSLIDLRPLAARQALGWVASLPLGRSFKPSRR